MATRKVPSFRKLSGVALTILGLWSTSCAAEPFRLTTVFDIGGGGCIGETRIYEEAVLLGARSAGQSAPRRVSGRKDLGARIASQRRYFLTTVGCGADRIAISLDGRARLLETFRVDQVGAPVTYFDDGDPPLQVRIERLATVRATPFPQTDCTRLVQKVSVLIEFNGATKVVRGIAIHECP